MIQKNHQEWNLRNTYSDLPDCFHEKRLPSSVIKPKLVYFNNDLAKRMNLDFLIDDTFLIENVFSGNEIPKDAIPIAQAYAGHQFGHFTMLGDGRAILLGEQIDSNGKVHDIQLKGSGQTSYSRRGDGKATLSSMLREYIMSESMHHLGIPTARSLAVVETGEKVYRETSNDGAILTRISSSHIRVGTFEYARHFCSKEDFQTFINYVINRHYPEISTNENPPLELLKVVMHKQIELIVHWMRVGFIHGVMNTDNMSISGETIDYGPCAFINKYDPKTVFSSIDMHGRYAFDNQPKIAYWNLTVFAGTLLPLISNDNDEAMRLAKKNLDDFPEEYSKKWHQMMQKKLGIIKPRKEDVTLIRNLIQLMKDHGADYTNTFAALTLNKSSNDSMFSSNEFNDWKKQWKKRIKNSNNSLKLMQKNNPLTIPRNHLIESALDNAIQGNKTEFNELLNIMKNCHDYNAQHDDFQSIPEGHDESYKTYCGT